MARGLLSGFVSLVVVGLNVNPLFARVELVSKPFQVRPTTAGDSSDIELSADGKWAVFTSNGTGITTNEVGEFILNVFLKNLETGETTLLSAGAETNRAGGNGHSYGATISADGRFVVFESEADNLTEEDANEATDVFFYDRTTQALSLVSGTTNGVAEGASGAAFISPNGQFVLFESDAADLSDVQDSLGLWDLYLLDREAGTVRVVSVNSSATAAVGAGFAAGTYEASVSGDGRYVAFLSAGTNLVAGVPPPPLAHVYLRDMASGTNRWLSHATTIRSSAFMASPVVSSNGAFVAFLAANLEGTSLTGEPRLYVYDIATGERSVIADTNRNPFDVSEFSISANSAFIAFASSNQIYLHDVSAGTTRLVSAAEGGVGAAGVSSAPRISDDGRYVIFSSTATNLAGGVVGEEYQTYRFDAQTGEIALLSRAADGIGGANSDTHFPVLSGNGALAGFMSYASNLVTNDNVGLNDVFVVSTSGTNGVLLASTSRPDSFSITPNGSSFIEGQGLSADGRRVVFASFASDIVPNDTNGSRDIFLSDLQSGVTRLVSVGTTGEPLTAPSTLIGVSLNADRIAFWSSNVVNGTNARSVFVYDLSTGTSKQANILQNGDVPLTVGDTALSPDGRYLAFRPAASGQVNVRILDTATTVPVNVPDMPTSPTQIIGFSPRGSYVVVRGTGTSYTMVDWINRAMKLNVSVNEFYTNAFSADETKFIAPVRTFTASSILQLFDLEGSTNGVSLATNALAAAISADGSTVAYLATNGLYIVDTETRVSSRLQIDGTNAVFRTRGPISVSADGRFVAFSSTNSFSGVPDDTGFTDIFVYDRVLKTTVLASESVNGVDGRGGASGPLLSADGRIVVFDSAAMDLVANDRNLNTDVFVRRLAMVDSDDDGLEDGWEILHLGGLNTATDADADNDGVSNQNEFQAGTDPNSATSRFQIRMEMDQEKKTLLLTTSAMPGRAYQLQHQANLSEGPWEDVGITQVAFSDAVTFEAPLTQQTGFFRVRTME